MNSTCDHGGTLELGWWHLQSTYSYQIQGQIWLMIFIYSCQIHVYFWLIYLWIFCHFPQWGFSNFGRWCYLVYNLDVTCADLFVYLCLGKPLLKKYRNFMKYFHKTVTPPHCFYEILIQICYRKFCDKLIS